MSFSGVKLPEFDTLVSRHTSAASQLEKLASMLHTELTNAGLDTAPAERIRKLAVQVGQEADDLRQRQLIVRAIEKNEITFGGPAEGGSLIALPDSLRQAQGQLDGTLAAKAAVAASRGDTKALAELQKYVDRANDSEFVKTFLSKLGAKGVTEIPAWLAMQARANATGTRDPQKTEQIQQVMKLLATALAKGTNPQDAAYMGEDYLRQLVKEGRAERRTLDVPHSGYQAQALIWRASDGKPPFSKRFMEVVGRDAIVRAKELADSRATRWHFPDLATLLGIGDSTQPGGPRMGNPEGPIKASVIDDLAQAAQYSAPAAQALLFHTPEGWNKSIMAYLLTDRLDEFNWTKNQAPFAGLLRKALSGHDKASLQYTNEALVILKNELEGVFGRGSDEKLRVTDPERLERLSFLSGPVGVVMAAHINQVASVFAKRDADLENISPKEMDRLLTFVARDEGASRALIGAQAQRMMTKIQESYRRDGGRSLSNLLIPEGRLMGHLLEARRLALLSQAKSDEEAKAEVKGMVNGVFSELIGPAGRLATRFGFVGEKAHEKLTPMAFEKLSALITETLMRGGITMDDALGQASNEREMTMWMVEQMIIGAAIAHGELSAQAREEMKGAPFATNDDPPKLRPLDEIVADPAIYDSFIEWARFHLDIEERTQDVRLSMDNAAAFDVHDNLGVARGY
jgi:hypothetical protein